jgi:putative mRNA 3-end processing factor
VLIEHRGQRVVVTGDYKRLADRTSQPFELAECDLLVTEATFGLPVFQHPHPQLEIRRLLKSVADNPERSHLVGAYALGKAQRVITELRRRGHEQPIYYHGAVERLCNLYEELGVSLGEMRHTSGAKKEEMAGHIVIAPPSALNDRWSRRLPDPVTAMASGWMRIRQRARQSNIELPLIISDHADWDELTCTIRELAPREVWITHGREEALKHWCMIHQIKARELNLVGYEDEDD